MGAAALVPLVEMLLQTSATLYVQYTSAKNAGNVALAASLIPLIGQVSASIAQTSGVLTQAQAQGWKDDDPKWLTAFAPVDAALAKAEARLT